MLFIFQGRRRSDSSKKQIIDLSISVHIFGLVTYRVAKSNLDKCSKYTGCLSEIASSFFAKKFSFLIENYFKVADKKMKTPFFEEKSKQTAEIS